MARAESGSITQLGKNRWRVRVSGGKDPVTGKRIRLTKVVHGTKKDAIAERTRMQVEVGQVDRAAKDITIAQYLYDVYIPYHEKNVRRTSFVTDKWRIGKYIVPELGHIQLKKLSAYTVEMWMNGIQSPYVKDDVFRLLRHSFNMAYKWSLIQHNVFDKIEPPDKPEVGEKVVADAELAALVIGAMYGEKIEPLFLLEISCGLRLSETVAIDWEDIDFKTGKVHIHRTYQYVQGEGCMFLPVKTKKSNRKVNIPKSVLDRLLEIRCEGGIVRFGALCHGCFHKNAHERITPGAYRHQYERIWERKLPNETYITLRNLRHSHATILLTSGVDIKTIADRLGHSSTRTTVSAYLQHVDELDVAASDVFDSAIKVASPHKEPDNIVVLPPAKEA